MASKQHDFKPGDIFFYARGHVVAQKDCVRGEPPKETTLWAVNGPPTGEWMEIGTFGRKQILAKEMVG